MPGILGWVFLLPLTGCATALTSDTATAGCLRNPGCFTTTPGEEAVIPWLSRTESAVRATATLAMLLADADIKLVEQTLTQCAQAANQKVNEEDAELKGQEPDREQCRKVVRREGNREVTRAMELGAKKHALAVDCVRKGARATLPEQRQPGADLSEGPDHRTVAMD